jgi:DNA repair protein RadD
MRELRPYQEEAISAIRDSVVSGVKRMILQLPTGGGKTRLSAEIAAGVLKKGNKLAFVVPRIDLCDQTVEEFWKEGITDVGVIQAQHPLENWSRSIQVCSIQTIERRGVFPEAQVVIFDEVHLWRKKGHVDWMRSNPNAIFIGLSATPWAKGLGDHFDSLIVGSTIKDLIAQGYLSSYKAFAPNNPDLRGIKTLGGDYNEGQLSDRLRNDGGLVADIVRTWKEKHGKDRTLVFAVDRAHAKVLQARFEQAGVTAGYQDAHTPPDERREIKRKFHSGEFQVVVSVGTLIIGVDFDVRCISFCRSTQSSMLFVQAIGRGLRLAPPGADEKPHLLLLDHSGTIGKLGFPEEIGYEGLLKGKSEPAERYVAQPKPCSKCAFMKPARTPVCPNCGFKAEVVSNISEEDGELQEVSRNGAISLAKKGRPKEYTAAEKSQFLAELKAYALEKGYKNGWAKHKFAEKFKHEPDWSMRDVAPAKFASMETAMFIKASNIRWAKSKERQNQNAATK